MTMAHEETHEDRLRLGRLVEARRLELRLIQREVVPHGMTYQNIMAGKPVSGKTKQAVEDALEWAPGSVDDVLAGGEPTPKSADADIRAAFADARALFEGAAGLDDEEWDTLRSLLERGRRRVRRMADGTP